MNLDPNPLYYWMLKKYIERDKKDRIILCNEGSTRSSKTFEAFRFIYTYCDHNRATEKDIFVFRDTLINCKDFTVKDFKRCFGREGLGVYEDKNMIDSPKPYYKLFNQIINFRGLDKESEATKSDLLFFNELLECDKQAFDGWKMRNENIIICDWNPRYTLHWAFDLEKLPNCFFSRTTYKHNKFLPETVVRGIEAYSPWMIEDMHLPENERRPHEENIRTGTADKYRWLVYGCGLRANREGLVFPNVTWIDSIPEDVEYVAYGMDFGTAAPTVISKAAMKRTPGKPNLYLQKLHYAPLANSDEVNQILDILKIPKHIWSDTDFMGRGWISDLEAKGKPIFPTRKFPGSRDYWITTLNRFNIFLVKDPDVRKEQENFCYRVVDGKQLSETIKDYDHFFSACGYATVGDFVDIINQSYGSDDINGK